MNSIDIIVTGECCSGKSTIASLIGNILRELNLEVEINDFDAENMNKQDFVKNVLSLMNHGLKINISTKQARRATLVDYPK